MIRVMADSDNLAVLLTLRVPLLATYSDLFKTPADLAAYRKQLRPGQELILIDRGLGDPTGEATVDDIEAHANTPGHASEWYDKKKDQGHPDLCVYVNGSNLAATRADLGPHRLPFIWFADLDADMSPHGFVPLRTPAVVQALNEQMVGLHCDISFVYEDRFHPGVSVSAAAVHVKNARAELHKASHELGLAVDDLTAAVGHPAAPPAPAPA